MLSIVLVTLVHTRHIHVVVMHNIWLSDMDWAIHSVDLVPPPDELVLCRCLVDGRQEGNRFIVKPLRKKQVSLSLPLHVSPWAFCKGFRVLEFRGNTLPVKNSKGQTA